MALSDEGRQRLREAIYRNQPWRYATGPQTDAGKARASCNAIKHGRYTSDAIRQHRRRRAMERWRDALLGIRVADLQSEHLCAGLSPPPVSWFYSPPHVATAELRVVCVRRALRWAQRGIRYSDRDEPQLRAFVERAERWLADHAQSDHG